MSEEFGPNFITLTDEDGNDIELEYVDALEDNGEELLTTLDSDQELQRVYDLFMEQLMDEDDENS